MHTLELLGTSGCHLCDLAAELLVSQLQPERFEVYQVDIADDDQLLDEYGIRIPVLREVVSGAELDWPFDTDSLQQFIRQLPVAQT